MTADLILPVDIIGVPTVREETGLAMSSRNGYLSPEEKRRASQIYRCLLSAKAALEAGERDFRAIEDSQEEVLRGQGFRPDYFAIRRPDLTKPASGERDFVILTAAWLGRARLIDNMQVRA